MKKILLTGIKPTGQPHLGNYTGAIRPALKQIEQSNDNNYLFIADYHSLTSVKDPNQLSRIVYEVAASWLACGADPHKVIIYRQSDIPELFELYWILSCITPKGLMNRAHSYKAHLQLNTALKKEDLDSGMDMGVFNYPILMAADILLFQAEQVPVGKDQWQHLEMTRDIALKFNKIFKTSLFKLPQINQNQEGIILTGMDGKKMSKSYNNHIPLFCTSKELRKKVMRIQTDSLGVSTPKDPNTSIVFQIYKEFSNEKQKQKMIDRLQKGCGWGEAKEELFLLLDSYLQKKREKYHSLLLDTKKIDCILEAGAKKARKKSIDMIKQIRQIIGISR